MSSDLRPGPDSPPTDELRSAEQSLAVLQQVVHTIAGDDLSRQTPCSEYDVSQLTEHLLNSVTTLGRMVDADHPTGEPSGAVEDRIIGAARPTLDAWHRHGLEGNVSLGESEIPAKVAASVLSVEFLVHAWDYAAALGREVRAPDPLVEYVLDLARRLIQPDQRARGGFAEPVEVAADAGPMDRLIAFTGRNPLRPSG
ncbi:TIGR03086 family protein [Mycobacterium sp. 852002-51163_SCH5372311]|uniref:TIGR03086 family metal-binding protein n=1 Tax=Mycobacterium sp. 852002-51163_SCH5372311 TaxID=1834097 RepID=UPI0007FC816A|nr:TIGR03086 family metal-binding protein [Mycobacterium sp. 852002-51163_SCH5372311]OBF88503.1 TIGR03086 family protein [Mycobacterium sp. 852002-51163_SCH5372311]